MFLGSDLRAAPSTSSHVKHLWCWAFLWNLPDCGGLKDLARGRRGQWGSDDNAARRTQMIFVRLWSKSDIKMKPMYFMFCSAIIIRPHRHQFPIILVLCFNFYFYKRMSEKPKSLKLSLNPEHDIIWIFDIDMYYYINGY